MELEIFVIWYFEPFQKRVATRTPFKSKITWKTLTSSESEQGFFSSIPQLELEGISSKCSTFNG
jgi:hypothetical protein